MVRNTLRIHGWRRWVELSVSLVIVMLLTYGATRLLNTGFGFLHSQGELGLVLLNRVYSLGWSVIFYLLVISNLVTALSTLYRNPDVAFLWTTRVPDRTLFRIKAIDNLIYSSWAVMILGLPLAIAYGMVLHLSTGKIVLNLTLGLIPFLLIASSFAQAIIIVIVKTSRWIRYRTGLILAFIVIVALVWIAQKYNQTNIIVAGDVPSTRYLTRYISNLGRTPFVFLPSFWFSQGISGEHYTLFMTLLISTALVFWEGLGWLAKKQYYLSWQTFMTQGRVKNRRNQSKISRQAKARSIPRALILKDFRQFVRSPQQWVQFLLFMILITVYLVNLSRVNYTVSHFEGFWDKIVFLLNFGFSGFILASLITRFVFPLISLEGRMRWLLFSSPTTVSQVYSIKFWMSTILFFCIAEWVALWSNVFLAAGWKVQVLSTAYLLIMSVTLTSISIGLGAVFPQFDEANPMRIVSGIGGIIAIVVSLVYVGLIVLSLTAMMNTHFLTTQSIMGILSLGFTIILSAITITIFYRMGYRAFVRTLQ